MPSSIANRRRLSPHWSACHNNNIKLGHVIIPASLGIISSSLISLVNYNFSDAEYRQDFEEVCQNSSNED